jgi:hypothetical protein
LHHRRVGVFHFFDEDDISKIAFDHPLTKGVRLNRDVKENPGSNDLKCHSGRRDPIEQAQYHHSFIRDFT